MPSSAGWMPVRSRAELLAPAGGPRALRAALAAGADAVYFGLERWSARAFAGNFAGDAAVEAVETAHLWGARAFAALNTLLKDDEVGPAIGALEAPYRAGLDAVIVADLGFAARVREAYPDLPLHASTQLNTHSSAQLGALARLGFSRAILARELSLAEIAGFDRHGLDLEAFVHGALCYGYSGDCLLASMVGGRSGNRGRCSQSCRLRYSLRRAPGVDDGAKEPARVMSTSDLAAIGVLPRLLAAGVTSFKVEGRMKDAAYVGVTTAVYREALDDALADPDGYTVRPEWTERLEQSFSRSFTTAHLEGHHHEVRSGGRGGHRGVLVGRVASVDDARGEVEVRLSRPVVAGDVVYLYTPWGQSEPVRLAEGGESRLRLSVRERVAVKDRLFRLAAADAGALARDLEAGRVALRPLDVRMRLAGVEGEPATLTVEPLGRAAAGGPATPAGAVSGGRERPVSSVTVDSSSPLGAARTASLTEEGARKALGALGGTPYRLAALEFAVPDGLFLSVGELKGLRRRALEALDEQRVAGGRRAGAGGAPSGGRIAAAALSARPVPSDPGVVLVLRPGERPLRAPGVTELCLDVSVTDTVAAVTAAAGELRSSGRPLRLRLPEILFDADEPWWRALLALPWQGVCARHFGLLAAIEATLSGDVRLILEYPLQGLNGLAAGVAERLAGRPPAAVVVSPETALSELPAVRSGLASGAVREPSLEALVFGRQQVLHTRDQLGRAESLFAPPEGAAHVGVALEDTKGYVFPGDVDRTGTRLYNARVTNLAGNLDELRAAGVGAFHVVQADLDAAERDAFERGGLEALAALASRERTTTGHLFRGVA